MCPFIKHLDLSFCTLLNDNSIRILAEGCKHLNTLNLTFCTNLTDKTCKWLSTYAKETLITLNLEECEKITDFGLQKIARTMPK